MKKFFCFRCKKVVPFFERTEEAQILSEFDAGLAKAKDSKKVSGAVDPIAWTGLALFYRGLTNEEMPDPFETIKHFASRVGMICPICDKPFRTPKARFCAECGFNQCDSLILRMIQDFKHQIEFSRKGKSPAEKNKKIKRAISIAKKIISTGKVGEDILHKLIYNVDDEIAIWIASHFVAIGDIYSKRVLEEMRNKNCIHSFEAKIILRECELGRHKPFLNEK